jgi:hypothetical protein
MKSAYKDDMIRHKMSGHPWATITSERVFLDDGEEQVRILVECPLENIPEDDRTTITNILSERVSSLYHVPSTEYSFRKKLLVEQIKSTDTDLFDNDVHVDEIFLSVFSLDCSSAASLERQYIWNIKEAGVYLVKEKDTAKLIEFHEAEDMIMSSLRKIVDLLATSDDPEEDFPGRDKIKKILAPVGDRYRIHTWWDCLDKDLVAYEIMKMIPSLSI